MSFILHWTAESSSGLNSIVNMVLTNNKKFKNRLGLNNLSLFLFVANHPWLLIYFCIVDNDTSPTLQSKYPSDQKIRFFQVIATYDSKHKSGFVSGKTIKQKRAHYSKLRKELKTKIKSDWFTRKPLDARCESSGIKGTRRK